MPSSDQGALLGSYTIIPRTLIFLTRDKLVLLIKGAANKRLWANKYNGIGGHIEQGEDVLTAARRELLEETNLSNVELWFCGTITIDTGINPGIGIYLFRGECSAGTTVPSSEGSLSWIPFEEIMNIPLVEDLFVLLPKLLTMKRNDPPLSALYTYNNEDKLEIKLGN